MSRFRSLFSWVIIVVGATVLSTLAISASDLLSGSSGSLLSLVGFSVAQRPCPDEMIFIDVANGGFCIDKYEVSPGEDCPVSVPRSANDTEANISRTSCLPSSLSEKEPWTNVPLHRAELLCTRAGKRLPNNTEWYQAAMGSNDVIGESDCVLGDANRNRPAPTESGRCRSARGVSDMVGNVWEWTAETSNNGLLAGTELPSEGYVAEVNSAGIPTRTSGAPEPAFGEDYFFVDATSTRGVFRGGFWGMSERAGVFTVNITVPPTFTGEAIGFRCVKGAEAPE